MWETFGLNFNATPRYLIAGCAFVDDYGHEIARINREKFEQFRESFKRFADKETRAGASLVWVEIKGMPSFLKRTKCKANARLIAAAPEMLRLLEDLHDNLKERDAVVHGHGYIFEEDEEARAVIARVLKQATGENPLCGESPAEKEVAS